MPRHWNLSRADFEKVVEEAMSSLPAEFSELLENVVVTIEEEPEQDDEGSGEEDDDAELLGVFRGTPHGASSFSDVPALPPMIVLFRGPTLRSCESRDEALEEIRLTLIHELGHYFGLEDEEMPY